MGYAEQSEEAPNMLNKIAVLENKLKQIEKIVLDRFCDWDMARCRIDFIINGEED
jgi:hypothetical protein